MKQYLSIVLRNQFNLFYRFGYTVIPTKGLVVFDGNINDKTKEDIIKQFAHVTPFEYDEEYLILHFERDINDNDNFIEFEIQELVAIYPLSQQAKTSIESKIDQRIRLEKPIFETILPEIETKIEEKEVERAISALWAMCKIEEPIKKYIENIGRENILKGLEYRKHGIKAQEINNEDYWVYLIAYERYDYFPSSTLGYFYDAGQVFAYSSGTTIEGTNLRKFLDRLNSAKPEAKFSDIINQLETEETLKNNVFLTTKDHIKQYVVAPFYLMFRDEIRKSDDINQTKPFKNLSYSKKTYEDSFYYAVILLGAFFGFRKFYDPYYEILNLRFYKDFKPPKKQSDKKEQQEKIETSSEIDKTVQTVVEEVNQSKEEQTKPKSEEKITKTITVEEQNLNNKTVIQTEEIQPGTKAEKQIDSSNTQQADKTEANSDPISQYKKIIEQALNECKEIKLSDIAKKIKEKTGNKFQNAAVENVVKQMDGIEIIKIGKAKGVRRRTGTVELPFEGSMPTYGKLDVE